MLVTMSPRPDCLPPLDSPGATILILGSFPSRESLARGEYYGHPRNHFWPLLARVAGEAMPADWPARVALARRLGVALWDCLSSCEREGSLDAAIRGEVFNDLAGFLAGRPSIVRVFLNGRAAAGYCRVALPALDLPLQRQPFGEVLERGGLGFVCLPSTSPIPTARFVGLEEKLELWRGAFAAFGRTAGASSPNKGIASTNTGALMGRH